MGLKKLIPLAVRVRARKAFDHTRAIGTGHRCPVCNSRVVEFEPLPRFYAENLEKYGWPFAAEEAETCNHLGYSCPYCQASDRDRLYALYLRDRLFGTPSSVAIEIVDFAPSPPLSDFIRKQIRRAPGPIHYRTADAFAEQVDDTVDIMDLPYRDGQFDFFLCSHVLEHVHDDRKSLSELFRILKPGGQGILMVPIILSLSEIDEDPGVTDEGERWRRFGQFDHVRLYSRNGFIERVRAAKFIIHEYGVDYFGAESFHRSGISTQSILYVVEK